MDSIQHLLAEGDALARSAADAALWPRLDWLDRLELHLPDDPAHADACLGAEVAARLRALRDTLEARNRTLYAALREAIAAGERQRLAALLAARGAGATPPDAAEGFDALDELVAGVLSLPLPGAPAVALGADMVAYQPTPARHVLDLLRRTALTADDVLVDLGAGLGQVPLLAALCTPARARGIEIEPAYVAVARAAAAALRLHRARFDCQDLRHADLANGSVFYLYTPLRGALLAELLQRLRALAAARPLRICAFGPCVAVLATEPWLRVDGQAQPHRVTVFKAGPG
ncbi:MAG TPA: hypothetical protein VD865_09015 [Stenotrophomonas sp.]|nr:hypothetical protein [Stenotrophomonas sp.]